MKHAIQSCLIASALLLAIAPLFLSPEYDWLIHTTSESAAQNIGNAWIARCALALYGVAILLFSFSSLPPANLRYFPFSVSLLMVSIWSDRPYLDNLTFDPIENSLHSIASNLVGISFIVAVISSLFANKRRPRAAIAFDLFAIAASIVIPIIMMKVDSFRGLAQRIMFLTSYLWFFFEVQINRPLTYKLRLQHNV